MDDVAWAREAATAVLTDVQPKGLRRRAETFLQEGSTAPAVLTLVSARAIDPDVGRDAVAERAAGVQLIYEGLGLTRQLSNEEPWTDPTLDSDQADLDVIVADVLVARGFYLLARTEAAERAVETVRAFGRDQTAALQAGPESSTPGADPHLEEAVFALAAVAGATAAGESSESLLEYTRQLGREYEGDLPPTDTVLDEAGREALVASVELPTGGQEGTARSPPESRGS